MFYAAACLSCIYVSSSYVIIIALNSILYFIVFWFRYDVLCLLSITTFVYPNSVFTRSFGFAFYKGNRVQRKETSQRLNAHTRVRTQRFCDRGQKSLRVVSVSSRPGQRPETADHSAMHQVCAFVYSKSEWKAPQAKWNEARDRNDEHY